MQALVGSRRNDGVVIGCDGEEDYDYDYDYDYDEDADENEDEEPEVRFLAHVTRGAPV